LHRGSGILLFLSLPLMLWLFQLSLRSIETYTQFVTFLQYPLIKIVMLGLLWAFLHHFCAGIRYIALDMHMGTSLAKARASAKWVMGVSLFLTVLIGAWLC
jgi:succinate dehydrogenase / fumarate reductase cytochrome b subunit